MNVIKFLSVLSFTILAIYSCLAQNSQLRISVYDSDNNPLPGAPVQLTAGNDSTFFFSVTGNDGIVLFDTIPAGNYTIHISYIGYKPLDSHINLNENIQSFDFVLSQDAIALEGITITAVKPLIRQEEDKMIIDPEPIAATTSNTLEVLESTPGLYVDPDGGIFISGTTPAVIYINGREQKMSQQDIASFLRSIPPNSVDRIEVLRSPSTKYDAASTGGIINVILKKGLKIGRFGSVNAGMNQGKYGNRYAGFSINNSGNKSTQYLNLNYNSYNRLEELNSVRIPALNTSLTQSSDNVSKNQFLNTGYGINYDLSPKMNMSYDGRVNIGYRDHETENSNQITNNEPTTLAESNNLTNNIIQFLNVQQDIGLIVKPDTTGTEVDIKLSYSYNSGHTDQDYTTEYISPALPVYSGSGNAKQNRHFVVFQSDLVKRIPFQIKLETGIKSTWQHYDSQANYFHNSTDLPVVDASRTNSFLYTENISSVYLQASRKLFWDVLLKVGIRWEHTNMNGNQYVPSDTSFLVNRSDFFPYIFLSRRLFKIMGAELFGYAIYRRTISRPGYHELNPYVRFVDQFLYETGNPSLKPQFTENIEINISFNDMPLFAIGRNYTTDLFSSVMYPDDIQNDLLVMTYDNLGTNRETYFRGIVGIPPGGQYFFALGTQYNLTEYHGFYENQPFEFSNGSWRFFTFHSLNVFKNTRITASGFMMRNGLWNFYELKPFGQINVGITQSFFNKKLTVTLNARDIFQTMHTEFEFNQGSIFSTGTRYTDNRRFGINVRYHFGIRNKEERNGIPGFEETEF